MISPIMTLRILIPKSPLEGADDLSLFMKVLVIQSFFEKFLLEMQKGIFGVFGVQISSTFLKHGYL